MFYHFYACTKAKVKGKRSTFAEEKTIGKFTFACLRAKTMMLQRRP